MDIEVNKSKKLDEISLILCGILFFIIGILDFLAGPPPSRGTEILNWLTTSKLYIAFSVELLFFAVVLMIPGIRSLNNFLIKTNTNKTSFGCAIMAVVIPMWAMLVVVQGRLAFPVFNINASPAVVELVVSLWYGGLHAVYELMAGATILVSFDLRKITNVKNIAYLGFITGIFDLIGAYPWLIGPTLMLVSQSFFSLWFMAVGLKLYKVNLDKI